MNNEDKITLARENALGISEILKRTEEKRNENSKW